MIVQMDASVVRRGRCSAMEAIQHTHSTCDLMYNRMQKAATYLPVPGRLYWLLHNLFA